MGFLSHSQLANSSSLDTNVQDKRCTGLWHAQSGLSALHQPSPFSPAVHQPHGKHCTQMSNAVTPSNIPPQFACQLLHMYGMDELCTDCVPTQATSIPGGALSLPAPITDRLAYANDCSLASLTQAPLAQRHDVEQGEVFDREVSVQPEHKLCPICVCLEPI